MLLNSVLPFYLGILVQAFLLLKKDFNRVTPIVLLSAAVIALVGFIPDQNEHIYNLYAHLLVVAIFFSVIYAFFFRKTLLTTINKEVIALWNLIFLYITFQHLSLFQNPILSTIIIVPSLIVLLNLFYPLDSRYFWKICFYVWFLIIIVGITSFYFSFDRINFFFTSGDGVPTSPINMFFIGASFLYLVVNFWYIVSLIPIPSDHQTFKSRLSNVKKDLSDFAVKYREEKISYLKILLLLIITLALVINFLYKPISDSLIIPLLIAISPFIIKK